jgi:hypothetical protein
VAEGAESTTSTRGAPPSDDYDVAAWDRYYAENHGVGRSAGAAAADDSSLMAEETEGLEGEGASSEGPQTVTGTLNPDYGPFPDTRGRTYRGGLSPDEPVVDHVRARAAGGDPVDPANLDIKSRESNAIKGGREGALLQYEQSLREAGMTEEQIKAVTEQEWESIMNDVHGAATDPHTLRDYSPFEDA